jgi:anaerobic ribonucleoside-triphosphate reductase activating protein
MAELNVALIIPKTEAEGPGERFAVWVQGCPMRCVGCCNPEFLAFSPRQLQHPEDLAAQALGVGVEGVSFLGGPGRRAGSVGAFGQREGALGDGVYWLYIGRAARKKRYARRGALGVY